MTFTRVAAAAAAIITALLLQATVVGPLAMPTAASLPAVLVAIVALRSDAATGMTFGFVAGLTADLASSHPAGVLALSWMALGVVAGLRSSTGEAATWRRTAFIGGILATLATVLAGLLLTVFGVAGAATAAVVWAPVTVLAELLMAWLLTPVVTGALRTRALRARRVGPMAAAATARRRSAGTGTAGDELAVVQHG